MDHGDTHVDPKLAALNKLHRVFWNLKASCSETALQILPFVRSRYVLWLTRGRGVYTSITR